MMKKLLASIGLAATVAFCANPAYANHEEQMQGPSCLAPDADKGIAVWQGLKTVQTEEGERHLLFRVRVTLENPRGMWLITVQAPGGLECAVETGELNNVNRNEYEQQPPGQRG